MTNENDQDLTRSSQQKLTKYSSDLIKQGLNLSKQISSKDNQLKSNHDQISLLSSINWENFFIQGIKNHELGEFNLAIDFFSKTLEIKKDCIEALILRGFANSLLGNQKTSSEDLYLALNMKINCKDSILALYSKACILLPLQAKDSVFKCYHDLLKIDPSYINPYVSIELFIQGAVYYLLEDKTASLEKMNQVLQISPNFVSAFVIRGEIYNILGDYQNSIQDCNSALRLNPEHINRERTFYIRACSYQFSEDYQSAINDYNKALQLNVNLPDAFYNRGLSYYQLGDSERAIENYNQVLQIKPTFLWAYLNRGVAYSDLGHYQESINDYTQALKIDPNFTMAYFNRSMVRAELGDHEGAAEDLQKANQLSS